MLTYTPDTEFENYTHVGGTAWQHETSVTDKINDVKTSEEFAKVLGLDYTVSAHNVQTDLQHPVPDYYGVYRDDKTEFIGISKSNKDADPVLIQNVDTFKSIEPMIEKGILVPQCIDSYRGAKQYWGCFKVNNPFDKEFIVYGDDFDMFFVFVNNHLNIKNGLIKGVAAPTRIACLNSFGALLNNNNIKFSIPAVCTESQLNSIQETVLNAYVRTINNINKSAENLMNIKISANGIEKVVEDLFPYRTDLENEKALQKANAKIEKQRELFRTCLNKDDVQNFKGTAYQVFNALTDLVQHYYNKPEKAYELNTRMSMIRGFDTFSINDNTKVVKFLKDANKYAKVA